MVFAIAGGGQLDTANYIIDNSLRFNDNDGASIDRTFGSGGNRKTWTWSCWVKRTELGTINSLFECRAASNNNQTLGIEFGEYGTSNDYIALLRNGDRLVKTSADYRDVSAWYHVVVAFDTTQSTASNRVRIYINGVEQTYRYENFPSQNADQGINQAAVHSIGNSNGTTLDGYLAEINFIDGQQLDASSFGEYDDSGIWKPIEYTGSYGTTGFYLDFKNSSNLGADQSGNGNNWGLNNIGTIDQMADTPTNNFCTLNPLQKMSGPTTTQANLRVSLTSNDAITGTHYLTSGKWYYEAKFNSGSETMIGWLRPDVSTLYSGNTFQQGGTLIWYSNNGSRYKDGDGGGSYSSAYATGSIIGCALNLDDNQVTWYKNGTSQGTISITAGNYVPYVVTGGASADWSFNFGNPDFSVSSGNTDDNGYGNFEYAPPSGFLAICTQNMAEETINIDKSTDYFGTSLWTSNGADRNITDLDFQPDFVIHKCRANVNRHWHWFTSNFFTSGTGTWMQTSNSDSEANLSNTGLTAYSSSGYTMEVNTGQGFEVSGNTQVGWSWYINGGTTVSNTDGTITSTVQVNTDAGISIGSYTGTGSSVDVGTGLSTVEMVAVKRRNASSDWQVGFSDVFTTSGTRYLSLNSDSAARTGGENPGEWQHGVINLLPNSSRADNGIFEANFVGTDGTDIGANGGTYIFYAFTSVPGFSKVCKYTGNGSTNGTYISTGFKPAWIMWKRTDSSTDWRVLDNKRSNPYNVVDGRLFPNNTSQENTGQDTIDFLSNGFKHRATNSGGNGAGGTYVYLAFAENPFVTSTGVASTAR